MESYAKWGGSLMNTSLSYRDYSSDASKIIAPRINNSSGFGIRVDTGMSLTVDVHTYPTVIYLDPKFTKLFPSQQEDIPLFSEDEISKLLKPNSRMSSTLANIWRDE